MKEKLTDIGKQNTPFQVYSPDLLKESGSNFQEGFSFGSNSSASSSEKIFLVNSIESTGVIHENKDSYFGFQNLFYETPEEKNVNKTLIENFDPEQSPETLKTSYYSSKPYVNDKGQVKILPKYDNVEVFANKSETVDQSAVEHLTEKLDSDRKSLTSVSTDHNMTSFSDLTKHQMTNLFQIDSNTKPGKSLKVSKGLDQAEKIWTEVALVEDEKFDYNRKNENVINQKLNRVALMWNQMPQVSNKVHQKKQIFDQTSYLSDQNYSLWNHKKQESNQRPQMSNQIPRLSNQRPHISNQKMQPSNQRPQISNQKVQVSNQRPQISNQKHQVSNQRPQISNQKVQVSNQRPQISNQKHQVSNQTHQVLDQRPQISSQRQQMSNQRPQVSNKKPLTTFSFKASVVDEQIKLRNSRLNIRRIEIPKRKNKQKGFFVDPINTIERRLKRRKIRKNDRRNKEPRNFIIK